VLEAFLFRNSFDSEFCSVCSALCVTAMVANANQSIYSREEAGNKPGGPVY
jgi:hypothetical protein